MQLTKSAELTYSVSRIELAGLVIDGQLRSAPYWVSAAGIELITDSEVLCQTRIAALLAQDPEVVILATGMRTVFPAPAIRAAFLTRRVGLEVMDTRCAAYTYNVLLQEQRAVILVVAE
jgi:uncharacterized protein